MVGFRLRVLEKQIERDLRHRAEQLFWNRKRLLEPCCRKAYLIEITPHRIIDDDCPAVREGPDRMANIAWHDPHHTCSGDLRHSVDGQLELAIDHLVYFFLRMEVFVNS